MYGDALKSEYSQGKFSVCTVRVTGTTQYLNNHLNHLSLRSSKRSRVVAKTRIGTLTGYA
jgi:hypothetical protein